MRTFSGPEAFDGGGGGGIPTTLGSSDSSVSIVEAPAGTFDLTTSADLIPSSGPSTVQADLDALAYITSAADLEARFPAIGGVHTIDQGSEWRLDPGATTIDITPNVTAFVYPGGLTFIGGQGTIMTAADAPVASGEVSASNCGFMNVHPGLNALCIDAESLAGRTLRLKDVDLIGQRPGRLANAVGVTQFDGVQIIPLAPGAASFEIDGTIGSFVINGSGVISPGTAPHTGFRVLNTASLGGMGISGSALLGSPAVDSLLYIDAAATIPAPVVVGLSNNLISGGGNLLDPAGLVETDPKVYALSNLNAASSQWLGDVIFDSAGVAAITLNHSGGVEVMPTENVGPTAVAVITATSQRFSLNIDAVQDFQVISTSRTDKVSSNDSVRWDATVRRNGGAVRQFVGWIQYRVNNVSAWQTITETRGEIALSVTYAAVFGSAPFTWDKTFEFRLVVQCDIGTNTDIQDWRCQIGPGSP